MACLLEEGGRSATLRRCCRKRLSNTTKGWHRLCSQVQAMLGRTTASDSRRWLRQMLTDTSQHGGCGAQEAGCVALGVGTVTNHAHSGPRWLQISGGGTHSPKIRGRPLNTCPGEYIIYLSRRTPLHFPRVTTQWKVVTSHNPPRAIPLSHPSDAMVFSAGLALSLIHI